MTAFSVIGAGVAGLTVAAELLTRGAEVTVIDRAEGPGGAQCSWWAGGMLAPWCERESADRAVVDLGRCAANWWAEKTQVIRNGTLVIAPARDRTELKRFARRTDNFDQIGAERIAALEPDLAGRFHEALFFPEEAHLTPRQALADVARNIQEAGATIRWRTVEPLLGTTIIDCRGFAASPDLPRLRGVKGEMLVIRTDDVTLSRPVRLLHPRHPLYIVPRGDGIFMLGATMIESADRSRITVRSMLEVLGAAYALHPAFAEAEIVEIGADVRPAFPDNLPRAERHGDRIHVNGLYRHGFLLAPAMARQAADLAMEAMACP